MQGILTIVSAPLSAPVEDQHDINFFGLINPYRPLTMDGFRSSCSYLVLFCLLFGGLYLDELSIVARLWQLDQVGIKRSGSRILFCPFTSIEKVCW